jgi:sigma-B regulation protein RsbU (phosphoserine phosphatase)
LADISARAEKAGLHRGDKLVSIDGKPIKGGRDFFRALHTAASSEPLRVEVIHKENGHPQLVSVPADTKHAPTTTGEIIVTATFTIMMLFCTVIGIYPAAILPRDPRALVFLGLMLATSQVIMSAQWYEFPPSLQFFAYCYHTATSFFIAAWLVLFALYFPHRFAWDLRRPWIKWVVILPVLAMYTALLFAVCDWYFSFHRMDRLFSWFPVHSTGPLAMVAVLFFFGALATKMATTRNRDGRRRLKILVAGCTISIVPLMGLVLYEAFWVKGALQRIPETILIPVCLLFCLFPITMAYVIVADRAMDLRMVVRQGIRYTLAKAGLRVVMGGTVAFLLYLFSNALFKSRYTGLSAAKEAEIKVTIFVVIAILSSLLVRRMRTRLSVWIDRRFFREAYNAEMILEDLSDSVRSMMNEDQMLETVARKISESLHVPQFAFLLNNGNGFHPVYCLGFEPPPGVALAADSKTIETVKESKTPPPIYFDREDNWVHGAPEQELLTLRGLHTQLLLPLGSKDKLLGLISLGQKRSEEPYSKSDLQLLRSVATQTGLALENSRLTQTVATEIAQREKLNREIEIAREVQERLFPQRLPVIAGIDYSGACRPALGVGGDYYDFLTLPNGDLGVAIGDVSGKGIAAALLMASLQASLRGQALMGQGNLAKLMTNVNQLVYDATPINRYATFFYGEYHRATGVFRYVNAGHNPPFILRRTPDYPTHVIRLETGGPVVGLFPGAPYQEGTLILEPGDIFVGFTDGISEAMNLQEEEWGEERLIPALAAHAEEGAAEIIPHLMAEADRFASGAPQHDDMTLVVMKLCVAGEVRATAG